MWAVLCVHVVLLGEAGARSIAPPLDPTIMLTSPEHRAGAKSSPTPVETKVIAVLKKIDRMHQDLFLNVTNIENWGPMFVSDGPWYMPVGNDSFKNVGPKAIQASLATFIGQLAAERSYMRDVRVWGNSGGFSWIDEYLTPPHSKVPNCMFRSEGYNQFFIDPVTSLITSMYTWYQLSPTESAREDTRCGIAPIPYQVSEGLVDVHDFVMTAFNNLGGPEWNNLAAKFTPDGLFWDHVGDNGASLVQGQSNLTAMFQHIGNSYRAFRLAEITEPVYWGDSIGMDVVLTTVDTSSCSTTVHEYLALRTHLGRISSFEVHVDRTEHSIAGAPCTQKVV